MSTKHHITSKLTHLLWVMLAFGFTAVAQPDAAKLFKGNCASCHKPTNQKLVGPGLLGIKDRWPNQANLIAWIRNSQEYLKTGDPYAVNLYNEYNKSVMPSFALSDEEIIALIEWSHVGGDAPPADTKTPQTSNDVPVNKEFDYTWILVGVGVLLLILIAILNGVRASLQAILNEKQGVEPAPARPYGELLREWAANNKKIVALAGLFLVFYVLSLGWYALKDIGVYEGYMPEQPIKFSHKLHAGENQIACQYCHTGVEKSKHANIPSANVCMNCHMYIQEGPQYGTEEIGKIYAALGYDPETRTYDASKQKPIEWVRVHALPDHAYFNHSQHVKVGKIECQQCHGPIQEMEVVYQHSPLTMGWCINCHRETEVDHQNNAYYADLHKQFMEKNGKKAGKFTVAEIGGLECSKCHY